MCACPLILRAVSAAHLGWRKPMSHPDPFSAWCFTVRPRRPDLSRPQAQALALWSYGMALTHTCGITTIVVVLAQLLVQKGGTVRWSLHWPPRWLPAGSTGAMTLQVSSVNAPRPTISLPSYCVRTRRGERIPLAFVRQTLITALSCDDRNTLRPDRQAIDMPAFSSKFRQAI